MTYEFHPDALEEYDQAAHYYSTKEPALDLRFIVCVEAAIASILEDPFRWRLVEGEVRRRLIRPFPYAVFYSVDEDTVFIVAIASCSREPGYWKTRLH